MKSEFIENLKSNVRSAKELEELKANLLEGRFRRFTPEDSNKLMIPVIVIKTKGDSARRVFQGVDYLFADSWEIGKKQGIIFLYNEDRTIGYPKTFRVEKDRILIDTLR